MKFKVINSYKYFLGNQINQNFSLVTILQENYIFALLVTHLIAWEKMKILELNKLINYFIAFLMIKI